MVFLFVATGLIVGWLVFSINPTFAFAPRDIRFAALNILVLFVPSILSLLIMARYVDRVPLAVFGVTNHEGSLRDLGTGVALAGGMLALTLVGAFAFGDARIEWAAS